MKRATPFPFMRITVDFCLCLLCNSPSSSSLGIPERPMAVKVISIFTMLWACFFSGLCMCPNTVSHKSYRKFVVTFISYSVVREN